MRLKHCIDTMIKLFKHIYSRTKFHTKLLMTYSSIVILILVVFSVLFYRYATILLESSARKDFAQTAYTLQKRIDYSFSEMNSVADRIKDNDDIKNQLYKFKKSESALGNRFTYDMWLKKFLLDALNIDSEIYRVSVFNDKGDFLSTNDFVNDSEELSEKIIGSEWYRELMLRNAAQYILEPHYDDWIMNRHVMVYSSIKPIMLYDEIVGFVEIQRRVNEYSQITAGIDNDAHIAIVQNNGKVFYSNKKMFSKRLINHYIAIGTLGENGVQIAPNPFSNVREMVSYARSKNGWTVYVIQNYNKILEQLQSVQNIMFFALLILMVVSVVFVYVFSRRLTVPLRKLKSNIETVDMRNLSKNKQVHDIYEHDEIEAINESFIEMQKRIKDSIEMEIKSRSLQAKAHFDALQARINPHFIFNMLGVIANMAEEADQEDIADVCGKLAKMLRYSTQSSDSLTTIKEEIEHAEDYLSLMKNRFEHRLVYKIDIEEAIWSITVPKFIIQPIIENSITHGFRNSNVEVMQIEITGKVQSDNRWILTFKDNGSGFKDETLKDLNSRINDYKEKVMKNQKPEALSIGGMGIINTFVRLGLYFGEDAAFDLCNNAQGGAQITIICPITVDAQEDGYV